MVEVFKTNVQCPEEARLLVQRLYDLFAFVSVSFDLEDCDKVLRIEGGQVPDLAVIAELKEKGYCCEVLE